MKILRVVVYLLLIVWISPRCNTDKIPEPLILNLPPTLPSARLPQNNPLTKEGVALGRFLFFDPILSDDSTQSCSSCHAPEYGFTNHNLTFSTGINGSVGKRNSMPLVNLMWSQAFFWDGRSPSLQHQVLQPITDPTEMNQSLPGLVNKLSLSTFYRSKFKAAFGTTAITERHISLALEQFLVTLLSGNSKADRVKLGKARFTDAEQRGAQLFNGENNPNNDQKGAECFHCHSGGLMTNLQFSNNGLDSVYTDEGLGGQTGNPTDVGKFKVPTLRNIALTAPYMHDGRFKTLEEVLEFYNSGVHLHQNIDPNMHGFTNGLQLTDTQKKDLIAFLLTFTDSSFIHNPAYQNPF